MMQERGRFVLSAVSVLTLMSVFTFVVFWLHSGSPALDANTIEFSAGQFSAEDKLDWQSVALPDDWLQRDRDISHAWYRFEFELDAAPLTLSAVYFPTLSQNLAVYINGVEIGDGGSFQPHVARNWPRPLMFPIAPEFLKTGKNEIMIWLLSDPPGRGLLTRFYLGERKTLLNAYSNRYNLKVTALTSFGVGLSVFAMLLISITLRRKQDTQYAWGGLALIGLACHSLPMLMTRIPVSSFIWEWWQHICIGFTVVAIVLFLNRYLGIQRPRLERRLGLTVLLFALASLAFLFPAHQAVYFRWGGAFWGALSVAIGFIPFVTLSTAMLRDRDPQKLTLLAAGTLLLIYGIHDALFVMGLLSRENGYLLHYASPLVAVLFTSILFSRFVQASTAVEELNNSLEKRVRAKSEELRVTYERIGLLQREKLITEERERFNRDMHDGLGGYLANALALAERTSGEKSSLASTLRDATEEMRLMIDSAEASGDDVGLIIGTLRPRLERQLAQHGCKLIWRVDETEPVAALGPASAMQLVRIVQEAISNACKHSGGNLIEVCLRNGNPGTVLLEISDNGHCPSLARPGGNGIQNIQIRADQVQGQAGFDACGKLGGLTVTVSLPTRAPSDHAQMPDYLH